jgi:hypothetical protein
MVEVKVLVRRASLPAAVGHAPTAGLSNTELRSHSPYYQNCPSIGVGMVPG